MALEVQSLDGLTVTPAPLPDLIYPDTSDGRREARRMLAECDTGDLPAIGIDYCSLFKPAVSCTGTTDPRLCDNRRPSYMEGHNRCVRCPAGYMFDALRGGVPD